MKLLVVDDERPALDDLVRLLGSTPGVDEVRAAADAKEALALLAQERFDGLFLDVRMPGIDGLELARVLRRFARPPAVVFVSAHQTAAADAFAVRALDYLMKPVSRARIEQAVGLVARELGREAPDAAEPAAPVEPAPDGEHDGDVVPVDNLRGGGTRLVARSSILYLQAHGDYVRIICDEGRFLLRARLSDIERRWEPFGFTRVHRGFVVNLRRATEVRPLLNGTAVVVFPNGAEVPIARRQVGDLKRRLRL